MSGGATKMVDTALKPNLNLCVFLCVNAIFTEISKSCKTYVRKGKIKVLSKFKLSFSESL
jgi:hypothetical protein